MLQQSSCFFIILIQLWSLLFSLYKPISTSIALEDQRIKDHYTKENTTILSMFSFRYCTQTYSSNDKYCSNKCKMDLTSAKQSKFFYFNTQKSQKNVAGCGLFVEWSPQFCKERTLLVHSLMYFLVQYIVYYSCVVCIYTWEKKLLVRWAVWHMTKKPETINSVVHAYSQGTLLNEGDSFVEQGAKHSWTGCH